MIKLNLLITREVFLLAMVAPGTRTSVYLPRVQGAMLVKPLILLSTLVILLECNFESAKRNETFDAKMLSFLCRINILLFP